MKQGDLEMVPNKARGKSCEIGATRSGGDYRYEMLAKLSEVFRVGLANLLCGYLEDATATVGAVTSRESPANLRSGDLQYGPLVPFQGIGG